MADESEAECTVPLPLPTGNLRDFVAASPEHQRRAITEYVETQARPEEVQHLEKVKSTSVGGRRLDVWDIHTDRNRWWVFTNLMNLYSQEQFPSMDFALTVHVGLMARLEERAAGDQDPDKMRLEAAWRKLDQAADALETADEAEEFQATGMRCREALLAFVEAVKDPVQLSDPKAPPKTGDFRAWAAAIADCIAPGPSSQAIRSFLKSLADSSWRLVNWLTHAKNATLHDAMIAIEATATVLGSFTGALLRHESGAPTRCPGCNSYRIVPDYRGVDSPVVSLCESCGWTDEPIDRQE